MRNSSLVKWLCAENVTGLSLPPKPRILEVFDFQNGRGAFQQQRRYTERNTGAAGSENAGMSSEKAGENPARRKPKVS